MSAHLEGTIRGRLWQSNGRIKLKTAWTDTMTSVHMLKRTNEITMRDSKSALAVILERLEYEREQRQATSKNRLAYAKIPRTMKVDDYKPVSYTHLTLPTKRIV